MPLDPFTTGVLSALGRQLVDYVAREQTCTLCGRLAWNIYTTKCCGVSFCESCGDRVEFSQTRCCETVLCQFCQAKWLADRAKCDFCGTRFGVEISGGGGMIGEAQGDARIRTILAQLNLKYSLTSDGDFKLLFDVGDGRTQIVIVNSDTQTYEGREIREVWAIGHRSDGELRQQLANELLRDNNTMKIGSWRVLFQDGKSFATFAVQIAAVPEGDFLNSILSVVAHKADALERSQGGGDEF